MVRSAPSPSLSLPSGSATITAIQPDPARPETVHIWVSGRRFCTVAIEAVRGGNLTVGTTVDHAVATALGLAADREAALRTALRALERRPFAQADLRWRLVQKGHPPLAVDSAIARLVELELLDDARYAAQYVQVQSGRGRGPARLRADLRRKGVESAVIERALAEQFPPGTDLRAQPLALARKRTAQLGNLPRATKRRRLLAYLARRGFRGREVLDVVDEILNEASTES
jgi:regulatory protein